ncbi:hypothetical protein Leryth_015918 [Lithospermum erythrorhizon]|nr:hypothetical protein Leryth_015918 [Lithospermum erythrorhizon]
MGRPPSNGIPSFRFNTTETGTGELPSSVLLHSCQMESGYGQALKVKLEKLHVAEMEAILQAHNAQMPSREVLDALAEKFSTSAERSGKFVVQVKQIWNWFQNRRYAIRAKAGKPPVKLAVSTPLNNAAATTTTTTTTTKNVPPPPQLVPCSTAAMRSMPQNTQTTAAPLVQDAVMNVSETQMEFEARSARDGAWYDVTSFISHRSVETGDPEVLVRFAGFGPEEDEWVNVRKHIRQRSLPCESAECIVVLPGDLILCFQSRFYYDAHILDSQRRRHDIRGCRCRFLVRYDHDQSEEIVPLRKICRRPETDHRLQQLDAESGKVNQQKTGVYAPSNNTKASPPNKIAQKEQNQTADRRANGVVALDDSQPISGSHTHSGHIPNVNKNSEVTHPMSIGEDNISTQVRPTTESHAAVEVKLNQISESTQLPVGETVSDTVTNQMFPSVDSHAADVVKVNQTPEMTQLPPSAETASNTVATQMLPALENHAAVVAETASTQSSLPVPSQSKAPLAESNSNTVGTPVLPPPENHAAEAASTQNSLPVSSQSEVPPTVS